MSFDLYADLAGQSCPATTELPVGLAGSFVNGCTAWFAQGELETNPKAGNRKKNDARHCYMKRAATGDLFPQAVADLIEPPLRLPQPGWLVIEVAFTLQTPWYSKDDRPFHVLDNPVRKDRVFGVPFMSAASWKGLLRWSMGMTTGLIGPNPIADGDERKKADAAIVHLFGNEREAAKSFQRGALVFYPTWFSRVGFEVINPHSRTTRAGTQPIYYEVVPARYKEKGEMVGTRASLRLLYAPFPRQAARDGVESQIVLPQLLDAVEKLLTVYGFSAKRTAGWGLASIDDRGWGLHSHRKSKHDTRNGVEEALSDLLEPTEEKV